MSSIVDNEVRLVVWKRVTSHAVVNKPQIRLVPEGPALNPKDE